MEQHPIPQDITGFQFKLVGDITLKQFAYVAGGLIIGYLIFRFQLIPALIRLPLAALFAMGGFGFAFLPIQQRPMDRWLSAFIKSIYSPTHFVWKKNNQLPEILQQVAAMPQKIAPAPAVQKPVAPPVQQTIPPIASPPQRPQIPVQQPQRPRVAVPAPSQQAAPQQPPQPPTQPVQPIADWNVGAPPVKPVTFTPAGGVTGQRIERHENDEGQEVSNIKQPTTTQKAQIDKLNADYEQLEKKLEQQMQEMQKSVTEGTATKERFMELQKLVTQLVSEKETMSRELTKLRVQYEDSLKTPTVQPVVYAEQQQIAQPTVKVMPTQVAKNLGIPQLTTYPNVITGVIHDASGTLLPNLIVTVKDREGMPVRALKTNKLGQFAASTPLADSTYIIEIDDPTKRFTFDRIEIALSGKVLPPLEISAKSEKEIKRQQLAQEIFGKNTV